MATNQEYAPSRTRVLPVPADTESGVPLMVGSLPVITLTAEGEGGNDAGFATCALDGAWDLAVGTTTALAVGDPIFFVTSSKSLSTTDNTGANPLYGYALEPKGTTAGEVIPVEIAQV